MSLYLEQYLDSLHGLPTEMKSNLVQMREFDAQCQIKLAKIDGKMKRYVKDWRNASREQRIKTYEQIQNDFSDAKEVSDMKINLATATYEMVDKHIRRLDGDLARFEADIKRRLLGASDEESPKKARKTPVGKKDRRCLPSGDGKKKKRQKIDESDDDEPSGSRLGANLDANSADHLASLSGPALFQQLAGGSADVDMPVDPNEPTYCVCHQVSYGEMVGCDNSDCLIEWFHFGCVGLDAKPKGKWFCQRCFDERRKKT